MLTSLIGFVIGLKKDYIGESKPPKAERATAGRQAGDGLRCPAETHLTVWKQADNSPPSPAPT